MKNFNLFRYIRKYSWMIAALSIISGLLFYFVFNKKFQTYTAMAIIKYNNEDASSGYAPDGTEINITEITSSNIMVQVMDNLGMDASSTNMDELRGSISITEIISSEEQSLQQSKLDNGEDYTIHPVEYLISFTGDYSSGADYPRTVLNEVLDVYSQWYGENHVNTSGVSNGISDITSKDYDYIEMTEMIDTSLTNTLDAITEKFTLNDTFRSVDTGYSFSDFHSEFSYIQDVELPRISSKIISQKITKNRDVLLTKYQARNESLNLTNTNYAAECEHIKKVIDTYVTLMSESGNTNIDSEYILDEVYDDWYTDSNGNVHQGDSSVEYDRLLTAYADDREVQEHNLLDYAYNSYIIDQFSTAEMMSPDEEQQEILAEINALVDKVNALYEKLDVTNDEFNEYLGGNYIMQLSSTAVSQRFSTKLFTALVVILFGILGSLMAVLLGRTQDFIDYYAFTDRVDGLPNRAKCDMYLNEMGRKYIHVNLVCVVYKITNIRELNKENGRDKTDEILKEFARILTTSFAPSDKIFVGNNGSGQYLIFAWGMDYSTGIDSMVQTIKEIHMYNDINSCDMQISIGFREAIRENLHSVRELLSMTFNSMQSDSDFMQSIQSDSGKASGKNQTDGHSEGSNSGSGYVFRTDEDYYLKFKRQNHK